MGTIQKGGYFLTQHGQAVDAFGRKIDAQGPVDAPAGPNSSSRPDATDTAKELAEEHGIDLSTVTGTGADGKITKADVEKAVNKG